MKQQALADRGTFIIDPDGVIQYVEVSAENVGRNAEALIDKIKAAQYVRNHPGEVCPANGKKAEQRLNQALIW